MAIKIIGGVLLALLVILLIYYFCEGKGDLKKARKEFDIFGLKDGFVPQGLCYSKWLNCFLVSGYMKNKKLASRIYVVDKPSGQCLKYILLSENKEQKIGHFGGITCFGDNIWIVSDARRYALDWRVLQVGQV